MLVSPAKQIKIHFAGALIYCGNTCGRIRTVVCVLSDVCGRIRVSVLAHRGIVACWRDNYCMYFIHVRSRYVRQCFRGIVYLVLSA